MMGGKSAPTPPPAVDTSFLQQGQQEMQNAMMQQMMQLQHSMMAMQPQTPQLPPMPNINEETPIDWAEKHDQLAQKMRADYNVEQTRRKNRTDTILTSPLLDDEDTSTTKSLLTGS